MWTMPTFSGGNTELTADMLNTTLEYLRRQGSLVPSPEVAVVQNPEGWLIRLATPLGMWARLTDRSGRDYSWEELDLSPQGVFVRHPSPRTGDVGTLQAWEANGLDCPVGTVVWLDPSADPDGASYTFQTPLLTGSRVRETFWAQIIAVEDGEYGYQELVFDGGDFSPPVNGRITQPGDTLCAVEANGATDVPVGTIVLMFDYVTPREGRVANRVAFRYGAAAPPRYAKLTGRTVNNAFVVDLAGPTGGKWVAIVTDVAAGDVVVRTTLPWDATARVIQDALSKTDRLGKNQVRVLGAESPFTIDFLDRLGGEHDTVLTIDTSGLIFDEGADPAVVPTCERVTVLDEDGEEVDLLGRDDPYTDGKGAYGWIEMELNGELTVDSVENPASFRPMPDGEGSDWPHGAAYEVGGETRVPPGTIVRIYDGPSVTLTKPDGSTVTDRRKVFQYGGAVGQWVMVGTAARWEFDLGKPTAGLFALNWDDGGKNSVITRANTSITIPGYMGVATSITIDWLQPVPTRVFVGPDWATQNVTTGGPTISLPADAAAVKDALEATYPMLVGNVTVTGGPLGMPKIVTTSPSTNPCDPTPVETITDPPPMVISLTGDLAQCANAQAFTYETDPLNPYPFPDPGPIVPSSSVVGSGTRRLIRYDELLAAFATGSVHVAATDCGSMVARPVGRPHYETTPVNLVGQDAVNDGPFTLDAVGYDGEDDLPEVTIAHWFQYGDDGTEEGEAVISDALPTPAKAQSAHVGGGLYHAAPMAAATVFGVASPGTLILPVAVESRLYTLSVVEANGRGGVIPKTIVRAWTSGRSNYTPGAVNPAPERWAFTSPQEGFWAKVRVNKGDGLYALTPSLTAYSRLRYVDARDANGSTAVPVDTKVWVESSAGDDGEKFVFMPTELRDVFAVVVYCGEPGVFPDEPDANGYVYTFGALLWPDPDDLPLPGGYTPDYDPANGWHARYTKCVIESPDSLALQPNYGYAGRVSGTVPGSEPDTTLSVYQVESPSLGVAAAGLVGKMGDTSQVLGDGSKSVGGGGISWWTKPNGWVSTGETMPAGARWQSVATGTEVFHGSTSVGGAKWGIKISGTAVPPGVMYVTLLSGVGDPSYVVSGISPSDTTITVVLGPPASGTFEPYTLGNMLGMNYYDGDFYLAVLGLTGGFEVVRVTQVCGDTLTVVRGQAGTTAQSFAGGSGGNHIGLPFVRETPGSGSGLPNTTESPIILSQKARFWTDQNAFAVDGTVGGTGSVTLRGPFADFDQTLTFAGGALTAISGGLNSELRLSGGYFSEAPNVKQVTIADGLVQSVANYP